MKKTFFKKILILMAIMCLLVTNSYGRNTINQEYVLSVNSKLDNIRKQIMSVSESGYINHINKQLNQENIRLVKFYMEPLTAIKEELKGYKETETNAFKKRNLNGLLAIANYLEDMGDNLIDYLSTNDPKEQFGYANIHFLTNQFIINIIGSIENAKWEIYES